MNAEARLALAFPTGAGQSETRAVTLNDGRQNPHKWAGTPYNTISGREIAALLKNPQEVQKERARWFLPSTYADHDARDHSVQRECGFFVGRTRTKAARGVLAAGPPAGCVSDKHR